MVQQLYLNIDGRSVYLNHYPFYVMVVHTVEIDKNTVYQLHGMYIVDQIVMCGRVYHV